MEGPGEAAPLRLLDREWLGPLIALQVFVAINAFEGLAIIAILPEIGADLGSVELLPLVLSSFLGSAAIGSLLAGRFIDARGPRPVMVAASAGFAVGSLLAATAPTLGVLVVGRVIQGFGSGLALTLVFATVGMIFPPTLTARVFATGSLVFSLAGFGGPLVAAGLLEVLGWRGVMGVITPIAIGAAVLAWPRLPVRTPSPVAVDPRLVAGCVVAIAALLTALESRPVVAVPAAVVGVVVAALTIRANERSSRSVFDHRLLTAPGIRHLHLGPSVHLIGFVAIVFYVPIVMRLGFGWSARATVFTPMAATFGWTTGAQLTGRVLDRIEIGRWHRIGATWFLLGVSLPLLGVWSDVGWSVLAGVFVFGMGMGIVMTVAPTRLQRAVAADELGRANAASAFARTVSASIGSAVAGALFFAVVGRGVGDVEALRDAFAGEPVLMSADALRRSAKQGFVGVHMVTLVAGLVGFWSVRRSLLLRGAATRRLRRRPGTARGRRRSSRVEDWRAS